MNFLEKVEIKKFWGDKSITIDFNKYVNFLIGVNGSGKTTVINMIAAALNADFHALDRLPFEKILITLKALHGNIKPSIEVEKTLSKNSHYPHIVFRIRDKTSEKPVIYMLDEIEEDRIFRGRTREYYQVTYTSSGRQLKRAKSKTHRSIIEHIESLTNARWLSIHRTSGPFRGFEDRSYESTIDRKIDDLSTEFVKYFSLLNRQAQLEMEKFQKFIFLSLVSDQSRRSLFSFTSRIDPNKEKDALIQIFQLFKLDEKEFSDRVDKFFDEYNESVKRVNDRNDQIKFDDFIVLLGTRRIHEVVQQWNKWTKKQSEIYKSRDNFFNIINAMMKRKYLIINEKNEIEVCTDSGKIFPLKYLSSGEKQLLILLGECLLQQQKPMIYIADEPELSLHVAWQENLVKNLRKINQNTQILFATHSPDIVSEFGDYVFDMENIIE